MGCLTKRSSGHRITSHLFLGLINQIRVGLGHFRGLSHHLRVHHVDDIFHLVVRQFDSSCAFVVLLDELGVCILHRLRHIVELVVVHTVHVVDLVVDVCGTHHGVWGWRICRLRSFFGLFFYSGLGCGSLFLGLLLRKGLAQGWQAFFLFDLDTREQLLFG